MNITSPILAGAANAAELPSDSVSTFLRAFGAGSPDGGLGLIMSALAGVAAALAVAIALSVYFRSGYPQPARSGETWPRRLRRARAARLRDLGHAKRGAGLSRPQSGKARGRI